MVDKQPLPRQWATGYTLKHGVTQSMLSDFLSCRRRMSLQLDGWEIVRPKGALRLGSMTHNILESFHKAIVKGDVTNVTQGQELVHAQVRKLARKNMRNAMDEADAQAIDVERMKADVVLRRYVQVWEEDLKRQWAEVEGVFDVDFMGYRLRGRRDGVFKASKGKPRNRLVLYETKTFSQLEDEVSLSKRLAIDFQCLFYLTALLCDREVVTKHMNPPDEVLYNMIRMPRMSPGVKESGKAFLKRLEDDSLGREDHYFKRFCLIFGPRVRKRFVRELVMKLQEFEAWLNGDLETYGTESSCVTKWSCEFLPICATGRKSEFAQGRVLFNELLDEE